MKAFLVHLTVSALLLLLVAHFVPGFSIDGFGYALLAALVLGIVNGIVRPLLILFTLPVTVLTLGLFLLVINALMLLLTAALVPGFSIDGLGIAFLGALLLALFNLVADALFERRR